MGGGRTKIFCGDVLIAKALKKDCFQRRYAEYPAADAFLLPRAGNLVGNLSDDYRYIAGPYSDFRFYNIPVAKPESIQIGINRELPRCYLKGFLKQEFVWATDWHPGTWYAKYGISWSYGKYHLWIDVFQDNHYESFAHPTDGSPQRQYTTRHGIPSGNIAQYHPQR